MGHCSAWPAYLILLQTLGCIAHLEEAYSAKVHFAVVIKGFRVQLTWLDLPNSVPFTSAYLRRLWQMIAWVDRLMFCLPTAVLSEVL